MESSDAVYHQQGSAARRSFRVSLSVPALVAAAVCLSVATHLVASACMGRQTAFSQVQPKFSPGHTAALSRRRAATVMSAAEVPTVAVPGRTLEQTIAYNLKPKAPAAPEYVASVLPPVAPGQVPRYRGERGVGIIDASGEPKSSTVHTGVKFGEDAGILPPVGYLDPLGFGSKASPDRLRWFREAELKHGRVAMLAAVGFLVGENPGLKTAFFSNHPEYAGSGGLASHTLTDHNLDTFWYLFAASCGVLEWKFFDKFESVLDWKLKPDYAVGDLGFDPLNLSVKTWNPELKMYQKRPIDADDMKRKRNVELQNGRLAMLAIAGFNAQELTDGKPIWPIHGLGSSASAQEIDSHIHKGLDLVKEMGQMLADTGIHH